MNTFWNQVERRSHEGERHIERRYPEREPQWLRDINRTLNIIHREIHIIMATQAELAAEVRVMKDQVVKIADETRSLINKVNDLIVAVETAGNVTPELQEAVNETKAQLQIVDELVADTPTP